MTRFSGQTILLFRVGASSPHSFPLDMTDNVSFSLYGPYLIFARKVHRSK